MGDRVSLDDLDDVSLDDMTVSLDHLNQPKPKPRKRKFFPWAIGVAIIVAAAAIWMAT